MSAYKVLVVDDSLSVRKTMESILQDAGYTVQLAESGMKALELVEKHDFDLITLDVVMEGLDGYDTCRRVRELHDSKKSATPIIFITSQDTIEGRNRGMTAGASDFLSKSNLRGEIVQTLDRILRPERRLRMTALVVAEDKAERLVLTQNLEEIFQQVISLSDGPSALRELKDNKDIELVVSDRDLPMLSGIKLLEAVRKNLGLRELPFIIITDMSARDQTLEFFKQGGTDCIIKPFMKEELQVRIRSHIDRVFLMREQQSNIARMKKLSDDKNAIIAACSHDLKTPLTAILGYTEILKEDLNDPQTINDVNSIEKAGKILQTLVKNILEQYRTQTLSEDLDLKEISIDEVVADCVKINDGFAIRKNIKLSSDIEQPTNKIMGDAFSLNRVLNNLVSNSLKFTKPEGSVTIIVRNIDNGLEITIKDTGIGMDDATIAELFKKFSSASKSGTDGEEGTGLGLMIAQTIIKLHHGEIKVSSKPGVGSEFSFNLTSAQKEGEQAEPISIPTAGKTLIPEETRVLVVDDDDEILEYLADVLEDSGFDVYTAETPEKAKESLVSVPFDVLVTDLVMPGINGLELARLVKKQKPHIKVILVTGAMNAQTYLDPKQDEGVILLKKPFDEKQLVETIQYPVTKAS